RYDPDGVERMLAEFDALSPGSPRPAALFTVGAALSDARQYEPAAEYLRRARDRAPNWPEAHIELGLLEMQSGRDEEAVAALRRAVKLDEFNVRAINSLKLIEELLTYEKIEGEHFIVRYRPGGGDEVMAREMMPPLDRLYEAVTGEMGYAPEGK